MKIIISKFTDKSLTLVDSKLVIFLAVSPLWITLNFSKKRLTGKQMKNYNANAASAIELITDKSLLVTPLLVMALLVMALLVINSPRWEFFKSSH